MYAPLLAVSDPPQPPRDGVLDRVYRATADDVRPCDGCGDVCEPFPIRTSRYCPPCAVRLLETPLDDLLHLTVETLAELRRALHHIAPNVLAAIDRTSRAKLDRLGAA
jgi:hypothetical protein